MPKLNNNEEENNNNNEEEKKDVIINSDHEEEKGDRDPNKSDKKSEEENGDGHQEDKPFKSFATKEEYTKNIKEANKNYISKTKELKSTIAKKDEEINKLKERLAIAKNQKIVFVNLKKEDKAKKPNETPQGVS